MGLLISQLQTLISIAAVFRIMRLLSHVCEFIIYNMTLYCMILAVIVKSQFHMTTATFIHNCKLILYNVTVLHYFNFILHEATYNFVILYYIIAMFYLTMRRYIARFQLYSTHLFYTLYCEIAILYFTQLYIVQWYFITITFYNFCFIWHLYYYFQLATITCEFFTLWWKKRN